jgi:hypothetical protein
MIKTSKRPDGRDSRVQGKPSTRQPDVQRFRPIEVLGVDESAGSTAVMNAYLQLADVFAPSRWDDECTELRASARWWRDLIDAACQAAGQEPLPNPADPYV